MIKNDTWYRCTVCGREGRVGRCCGDETREPLNELAKKEQKEINSKSFGVYKLQICDSDQRWRTPTDNAELYIRKNGVTLVLNEDEIKQVAKAMEAIFRR
jgi:hypothetical protein